MRGPRIGIKKDKLVLYLLDLNGKDPSRAKYFLGRGFTAQNWFQLADALAQHAFDHWPGRVIRVSYGVKHVITGTMVCPDGSTPDVLSVWKVETGDTVASLVTAYPNR